MSRNEADAENKSERPRRARSGRKFLIFVVLTLALMALIPSLIARLYVIPSQSMETTLHGCAGCTNDRVLVDRIVYRFRAPRPGEVVVFAAGPDVWKNSEVQAEQEGNPLIRGLQSIGSLVGIHSSSATDFVKRTIAVGGQTVACCDPRNRITVDGTPVDEPYLYFSPSAGTAQQQPFAPVRVPDGDIFVMGDNRNDSVDSRAPGNGPIPLGNVVGKARIIMFPFDRFGGISDVDPQPHAN